MLTRGTRIITSQHGKITSRIKTSPLLSLPRRTAVASGGGSPLSSAQPSLFFPKFSTCAARTQDDIEEEEVVVEHNYNNGRGRKMTALTNKTNTKMPRLQKLRQRLENEPSSPPSFLKTQLPPKPQKAPQNGDNNNDNNNELDDDNTVVQEENKEKIHSLLVKAKKELNLFHNTEEKNLNLLTDKYNRHHSYLRISLSERCNLRCQYCMPPEGVPLQKKEKLLSDEEILKLVDLFVGAGVKKIRLTGGEPLLRPSLPKLLDAISTAHPHLTSLGITTNGLTLSKQLPDLIASGLTHVNISLDTLHPDKFIEITRRKGLDRVMRAIDDTVDAFYNSSVEQQQQGKVKVNCVVMKGFNDNELYDFVNLTKDRPLDVRFIEWMPFADNGWDNDKFVSYKDMMTQLQEEEEKRGENGFGPILQRETDGKNDTTKWYSIASNQEGGGGGRVGFITSMSQNFCSTCNRLRITADGNLKVCLFGSDEVSLRDALRMMKMEDSGENGLSEEDLKLLVHTAVLGKKAVLGGHGSSQGIKDANDNRPMTLIGG